MAIGHVILQTLQPFLAFRLCDLVFKGFFVQTVQPVFFISDSAASEDSSHWSRDTADTATISRIASARAIIQYTFYNGENMFIMKNKTVSPVRRTST